MPKVEPRLSDERLRGLLRHIDEFRLVLQAPLGLMGERPHAASGGVRLTKCDQVDSEDLPDAEPHSAIDSSGGPGSRSQLRAVMGDNASRSAQ